MQPTECQQVCWEQHRRKNNFSVNDGEEILYSHVQGWLQSHSPATESVQKEIKDLNVILGNMKIIENAQQLWTSK